MTTSNASPESQSAKPESNPAPVQPRQASIASIVGVLAVATLGVVGGMSLGDSFATYAYGSDSFFASKLQNMQADPSCMKTAQSVNQETYEILGVGLGGMLEKKGKLRTTTVAEYLCGDASRKELRSATQYNDLRGISAEDGRLVKPGPEIDQGIDIDMLNWRAKRQGAASTVQAAPSSAKM